MSTLNLALRNTFRKNNGNIVKILSLGAGLTIALVLIAKILFELSFDSYFPDNERIYGVFTNYAIGDGKMEPYNRTSGAIAWGMKNEIPEVENSTRFMDTWQNGIYTENRDFLSLKANPILADENFFDILYRPLLIGDAKTILSTPMQCLVSKTLAEKIGMEDIVGKTITLECCSNRPIIIAGVFEDFPENSTHNYDVIISLKSIGNFWWDGSENWIGNDQYYSFVKLLPGVTPESIADQVTAMFERNVDMAEIEKYGMKIEYFFVNIREIHKDFEGAMSTVLVFGLLAAILLITAILNYTLVVISTLTRRTKEIAVHKCYGASGGNIYKLLFTETVVHLFLALIFAVAIIMLLEDNIITLLNSSFNALFAPQILWILGAICALILLITGFLPALLFSKIPVTAAFKKAGETHRKWKMVLIFIEVSVTSFIIAFLFMIGFQYQKLIKADQGYSYENLLYAYTPLKAETRHNIVQELKKLSEVKNVSLCSSLPVNGGSGNIVSEIGSDRESFHIADFYEVDENFLSILEIPVIEGKGFKKGETGSNMMMVSEFFAEKMAEMAGWTDGVVDKSVELSEHGEQTICGVFKNIVLNPASSQEYPAAIFYDPEENGPHTFLIKMHEITPQTIEKVTAVFHAFVPDQRVDIKSYEEIFLGHFYTIKIFRTGFLICSIVTLLLALIGLIGYLHNETERRRSEIAIRKVNGATTNSIQGLFIKNILKPVIPAILVGIISAMVTTRYVQEYFIDNLQISLPVYICCAIFIAAVILSVVSLSIYRAAARNPVENLEN